MSISPFKLLLVNLDRELTIKDVDVLKYLADLGDAVAEECDSGLAVFKVLYRLRKIAPNDVNYLKELMNSIDRHDLISVIGVYRRIFYLLGELGFLTCGQRIPRHRRRASRDARASQDVLICPV